MPRIKLIEQNKYPFSLNVTLQPRDINYGGHLGNDALISLLGSARVDMLHSLNMSEGDLGDGRTGIIMSDLVVSFKAEAYMFDELCIETNAGEFSRIGFRIFHRVTKKGGGLIALAETGMTTFNYSTRKIAQVPDKFLEEVSRRNL